MGKPQENEHMKALLLFSEHFETFGQNLRE